MLRELDEAIAIAKARNQPNALINAASLRAKLGGLLIDRAQVVVGSPSDYRECASVEELARSVANEMLDGLPNARWLSISDADRQELASMVRSHYDAIQAFVDQVEDRPLQKEAVALLTNGQSNKPI